MLPNEIRPYLPSGIVKVQNGSLDGHVLDLPSHYCKFESIIAFFSQFSMIVLIMTHPTLVGIRHEVLALAREGMPQSTIAGCVGLTRACINRILQRHAVNGTFVPGKSTEAPQKTTHRRDCVFRMVWQDRFKSARALTVRLRNLYGMRAGRWQHVICSNESSFQLYPVDGRLRVHRLPNEHFQQRCQAYRVQAGGGSIHVWEAYNSGAKSSLVLPDRYFTSELHMGILQNTLVPFERQHFKENYRYQDDNATSHCALVVLDFHQRANVSKMVQPARLSDCNPTEHIW